LTEQEVREATVRSLSFGRDDLAIIDWNAAVLVGEEMDDVQAVLEFANVELLDLSGSESLPGNVRELRIRSIETQCVCKTCDEWWSIE